MDEKREKHSSYSTELVMIPLFRQMVQDCAADKEYTTEEIVTKLSIEELHTWLIETGYMMREAGTLAKRYNVSEEFLFQLSERLSDPFTICGLLIPLWRAVTVFRPPPPVQLAYTAMELRLTFEDGKALAFAAQTPLLDLEEDALEGVIVTILDRQMQGIIEKIAVVGIAKLYAEHATPLLDSSHITADGQIVKNSLDPNSEEGTKVIAEQLQKMLPESRDKRLEFLQSISPPLYRRVMAILEDS